MVTRLSHGRLVVTYPDLPDSLAHSLLARAEGTPDRIALTDDNERDWTCLELAQLANRFGRYLRKTIGLNPGDRVALLLDCTAEFVIAAYGCNWVGGVIVPLSTKLTARQAADLVKLARAQVVVCEPRFAAWFDRLDVEILTVEPRDSTPLPDWLEPVARLPQGGLDDDAVVMFTSGTTSQAKAVVLTNLNLAHAIISYQRTLGVDAEDRFLLPVPIYHITGLVAVLGLSLQVGARLFLHKRFNAERVIETMADKAITMLHASPTVFGKLLDARVGNPNLPSVRLLVCGAAHMPISRIQELHQWMPRMAFRTVYGLTETASPAFIFPGDAATSTLIGSSGVPIPGLLAEIVGPDGAPVPPGEPGEITLFGAGIARAYDSPQNGGATPGITTEGWLFTGDIGVVTSEGYLRVVDRKKDMINRGGEKIWCIEVEEALRQLEEVSDAAVVAVPDEVYGEVVGAVVVANPGAILDPDLVRERLKSYLAPNQIPQRILTRSALPLAPTGKIDKRAIRQLVI
jgi:fatty-acyl-CoA synthase/long-chain acyl-CoA synthetase